MIVTRVQIKTATKQKHLYCLVFTPIHCISDGNTVDFFVRCTSVARMLDRGAFAWDNPAAGIKLWLRPPKQAAVIG